MRSDAPTWEGALTESHLTQETTHGPSGRTSSRRIGASGHPPSGPDSPVVISRLSASWSSVVSQLQERETPVVPAPPNGLPNTPMTSPVWCPTRPLPKGARRPHSPSTLGLERFALLLSFIQLVRLALFVETRGGRALR
jgi:hypothetical protein